MAFLDHYHFVFLQIVTMVFSVGCAYLDRNGTGPFYTFPKKHKGDFEFRSVQNPPN